MVRRAGLIGVGALSCALVLFGADSPVAGTPSASGVAAPAPAGEPGTLPVTVSALEATPPTSAPAATRPSSPPPSTPPARSSNRRSRRNVWVGPVPTPADWAPPEGPTLIALQAGHWRADEAPAELSGPKDNGAGIPGKAEWEVNLDIAERAAALLEDMGYLVDVLPAVVPPSYRAHLFISIHADGSGDPRASGFRVAAPRNDQTGRASDAARLLENAYAEATGIKRLPTVTRRMQNYYAFNFRRYVHALHPMTIGVILETGFLTSAADRGVIVEDPDRAARGIAAAVAAFPLTPPPRPATTLVEDAGD